MGLKLMTLGKGLIGQHLVEEVDADDGPVELNDEEQVPHDEAKQGKRCVPGVGLEPTLQWNSSLSRARLPIPPSGQGGRQI